MNQVVNHLDKLALMSNGGYRPKAIIRTGIGSERPLHPQHQHVGDFTDALRLMCQNDRGDPPRRARRRLPRLRARAAARRRRSTLIVE